MPSITVTEVESNKFIRPKSDHNKTRITSNLAEWSLVRYTLIRDFCGITDFISRVHLAPVNHGVDNLTLNAGASGRPREWNPHQSIRGIHSNTPIIR